jgi:hypothetical protein
MVKHITTTTNHSSVYVRKLISPTEGVRMPTAQCQHPHKEENIKKKSWTD